jgi:hypothetical protein
MGFDANTGVAGPQEGTRVTCIPQVGMFESAHSHDRKRPDPWALSILVPE